MGDWATYQLQDFIPFSADVYFRLLARMGESFWPLSFVTVALGAAALGLAIKGRGRFALALIAPLWAFVGVAFFAQRYADLNWAGDAICWAWLLQSLLLLLAAVTGLGLTPRPSMLSPSLLSPPVQSGVLIALCGLIGYPLLALAIGNGWLQAELFGIHPDPTAVVTLGVLLIVARGLWLWTLVLVPTLWLIISGLTLKVLGVPWYPALFVPVALVLAGLVASRRSRAPR